VDKIWLIVEFSENNESNIDIHASK
jgi:hypothetical protein